MKRTTKKATRSKTTRKSKETSSEPEGNWDELEVQADRLKSDWSSLAALMGINSKGKPA